MTDLRRSEYESYFSRLIYLYGNSKDNKEAIIKLRELVSKSEYMPCNHCGCRYNLFAINQDSPVNLLIKFKSNNCQCKDKSYRPRITELA